MKMCASLCMTQYDRVLQGGKAETTLCSTLCDITKFTLLFSSSFLIRTPLSLPQAKKKTSVIRRFMISSKAFTGGASGADLEWSFAAIASGIPTTVVSFNGHKRERSNKASVVELSEVGLKEMDEDLHRVAYRLRKNIPRNPYTLNLLRRNIYVSKQADAIYAVTTLTKGIGLILGGTSWVCTHHVMFHPSPNLYVYDMGTKEWKTFSRTKGWERTPPPHPSTFRSVALVGSREITDDGKEAIKNIFNTY